MISLLNRRRSSAVAHVPLGRITIAAQAALALVIAGYLLSSTGLRSPFAAKHYAIVAQLHDAAGLDEHDRPAVTVAGAASGSVESVRYLAGQRSAVARLDLDPSVRGKLFADASVSLRPRSALGDLVIDVDPGDPSTGPLRGTTITARSTESPVGFDRVLGVLDDNTRAYSQILVGTLQQMLADRPGPLRDAVHELPDLTSSTANLARKLARRRTDVSRLVGEIDRIFTATGRRGDQLTGAINAARRTLEVTAARRREMRASIEQAPRTLGAVNAAMTQVSALDAELAPALTQLRPAARALPGGLHALRGLIPPLRATTRDVGALARDGGRPLRQLRRTLDALGPAARALEPVMPRAHRLVEALADARPELRDLASFWPGALSSSDDLSVVSRALFLRSLPLQPAAFGLESGGPQATLRVRLLAGQLAKLRPVLFERPSGTRDIDPVTLAVRALVADRCRRANNSACLLLAQIDADPPRLKTR